jgi:hypothetical protein
MPPLVVALRPSRLLAAALYAMHGLALACVLLSGLSWWLRAVLAGAVLASLLHAVRSGVAGKPGQVLRALEDGTLEVEGADGEPRRAQVWRDTCVYSKLIVLRYRCEGERQTRSLVLAPGSADAGNLRRLRVWLRWRAAVSASSRPPDCAG